MSEDAAALRAKFADREGEHGVVANVVAADRSFKSGAKVWLLGGTGGEGWFRFRWWGRWRGAGRPIEKWAPTERFHNFRAAWIPAHVSEKIGGEVFFRGSREAMTEIAQKLEDFAEELRAKRAATPPPRESP